MATARELIEQADALMRRNRPPQERPAGVVHASPMPAPASRAAPPEVDVADRPPEAPPPHDAAEADVAPAREQAEDVPLLTEAVVPAGDPPLAGEDVPLLTDAVEEIEAQPADDGLVEGEASDWGVDEREAVDLPESADLAPAVLATGSGDLPEDVVRLVQRWDAQLGIAAPVAPPPDALTDDVDRELGLTHRETAQPRADLPAEAAVAAPRAFDAEEHAPSPRASPGPADVQWESLAEEIRMQVLQRIDIFTDTGLREQLGERLKPVVDRASADLVATINQHVGDLLRAYVAEAIEREIEKWKRESAPPAPGKDGR